MSTCTKCFIVTKNCQVCDLKAKNEELEKKLEIAVKLLTSLRSLIELSMDSEHNYVSWMRKNYDELAAINKIGASNE